MIGSDDHRAFRRDIFPAKDLPAQPYFKYPGKNNLAKTV
jgi:hypothetical protein